VLKPDASLTRDSGQRNFGWISMSDLKMITKEALKREAWRWIGGIRQ